jgi:MFS family permease
VTALADKHPSPAPRSSWALITDRTFGVYFVGNLVSNCGTWLQNVAAAIVVYRLTRSNTLVGAVSMLQFAASLLLAPWAGALSDRMDRRHLLLWGQVVSVAGAAGLAVWTGIVGVEGLPGPWPIFAAATLIGIGWAISVPTMQALVPALVEEADLDQAIALNSITFNLARAIGPALGAVALVTLGAAAAFGLNAATYCVLILALLMIRPREVERRSTGGDGSVREGLRYVRSEPGLVVLLIGVTALGFGTDPVNTLTPAMAEILGGGDALVGWMVSAFGIGAALMAFGVGSLRQRFALGPMGVVGLGVLAAGLFLFAASPVVAVALAALAIAGVGFLIALTALTTELQRRVPEALLGRVMALWTVAFLGSRPVAALFDGAIGDAFGPRRAITLAACLTAAVAFWVHAARRRHGLDDTSGPLSSAATERPAVSPPAA